MTEERRNQDIILGQLIAESKSSQNQRAELFKKMDKTADEISTLTRVIEKSIACSEKRLEAQGKILEDHADSIKILGKFKGRCMAAFYSLSGTSGVGVASYFSGIFKKLGIG